jgi:hypothetical protein
MALCTTTPTPCQWFSPWADLLDAHSAPRLLRLFLGAVVAAGAKRIDLMAARLVRSPLQPILAGACIIWHFRKKPGGADPASGRD